MNHPEPFRLTEWVHELLAPEDASDVAEHVALCGECGEEVERVRAEALVLAEELAPPEGLKRKLLAQPRPRRSLFWQSVAAAVFLVGLVVQMILPSAPHHSLLSGRVVLEDGSEIVPPGFLAASASIEAVEQSTVRLADGSTIDLPLGTRVSIKKGDEMKGLMAGYVVTVLAGSVALNDDSGRAEASPGQALYSRMTQDDPEALLRRLEELTASITKLEQEIKMLESVNNSLLKSMKDGGSGIDVFMGPGRGRTTIVIPDSKDQVK